LRHPKGPALYFQRSQGERVGNIAFGCRLSDDGQHLEPDPAEQAALAEIRRLRASSKRGGRYQAADVFLELAKVRGNP
jgi:hypothetical protein